MANEAIAVWGTEKTLEANGGSIASAAVTIADDATYGIVADGASYPDAEFVLVCQWATVTSIENKSIALLARDLDIDSTNDQFAPTATFNHRFIGAFNISAGSANTNQYFKLTAQDVPKLAQYYLLNQSGQTISAGWTLKVTPKTYKPAA